MPISPEDLLKVKLRDEQIKRKEDFVEYQRELNHWKKQWKISEEACEDQKRLADVFEADCEHLQEKVRALRAKLRKKREQLKNAEAALGDYDDIVKLLEEKVEKIASHLQLQTPAPPRNEGRPADERREGAGEGVEV